MESYCSATSDSLTTNSFVSVSIPRSISIAAFTSDSGALASPIAASRADTSYARLESSYLSSYAAVSCLCSA